MCDGHPPLFYTLHPRHSHLTATTVRKSQNSGKTYGPPTSSSLQCSPRHLPTPSQTSWVAYVVGFPEFFTPAFTANVL